MECILLLIATHGLIPASTMELADPFCGVIKLLLLFYYCHIDPTNVKKITWVCVYCSLYISSDIDIENLLDNQELLV